MAGISGRRWLGSRAVVRLMGDPSVAAGGLALTWGLSEALGVIPASGPGIEVARAWMHGSFYLALAWLTALIVAMAHRESFGG